MTETQKEIFNFFYDAMCTLFCGWQGLFLLFNVCFYETALSYEGLTNNLLRLSFNFI